MAFGFVLDVDVLSLFYNSEIFFLSPLALRDA
jgi:hypothetical protein